MRLFLSASRLASIVGLALLLINCGGGGSGGASLYAPPPASAPAASSTATNLVVELDKTTVANTGVDSVGFKVTALDAANNTVSGASASLSVDSNAYLTAAAASTGSDGSLSGSIFIGSDKTNRLVTLTATIGSVTKTASFQVVGASLTGTLIPPVVSPNGTATVQFRLVDKAGSAMADQPINVTATGLIPAQASGTTGPNGEFTFNYTAPATPGSYQVLATSGGSSLTPTLSVQVQGSSSSIGPVTSTISSASVSANPSVVGINSNGSTANRSEIRALFLSLDNKPVANVRVRFGLAGDVNNIGGTFSTGDALLYSDSNGVVSSAYFPGGRSSPTGGVTIQACYSATDFPAGTCPQQISDPAAASVKLTVAAEPLAVSIGTNGTIIVNELTYIKKFVVSVVDSAGRAQPGVDLAVSIDLPNYYRGHYVRNAAWVKVVNQGCLNEDANRNGVSETFNGVPEDLNGNGRLDPGKSDVSVSLLQSQTRADGTAELQIQYAQSFGSWVDAVVTVSASGISGTEGRASYTLAPVPVDADAITAQSTPAFAISPYGDFADCTSH